MEFIMDCIIMFLNYQPLGDWGVMNLLSIRMFHIVFGSACIYLTHMVWTEHKENK